MAAALSAHAALPPALRASARAPRRGVRALRVVAAAAAPNTLVKVCGVTTVEDCEQAVEAGANFIGMIVWPKSKRSVTVETAAEVAAAAKAGGAVPVGVFVDESAEEIVEKCAAIGIDHAQLHGDGARAALKDLPTSIKAIWVVNADADGRIVTPLPGDEDALVKKRVDAMGANPVTAAIDWVNGPRRTVDWVLVDGVVAGSGETYDWNELKAPKGASRKGWILAGGLDPENVSEAIMTTRPTGVDVASGVTKEGGVLKDPTRVEAFIANAKAASAKLA